MLLGTSAVVAAGAAAAGYNRYRGSSGEKGEGAESPTTEEAEWEDAAKEETPMPPSKGTWKMSSGRDYGRDGYVFGDVTRGIVVGISGYFKGDTAAQVAEHEAAEAAGEIGRAHV